VSESQSGLFNVASVPDGYRQYLQPAVFDPWARELLAFVPPPPGGVVLDIAAGTGAVAHAAAKVVGPGGRVIAADVSPLMLAGTGLAPADDRAAVDVLECPADRLALPDASVDAAYCQQGLQFMEDRAAVMGEARRVLRSGGVAGIAVWSDTKRPEPFDTYARILQEQDVPEPYPGAFDTSKVTLSERAIESLLVAAGFAQPSVRTVELELAWPDPRAAAFGIMGSSYGPAVASLTPQFREAVLAAIMTEFSDRRLRATMVAVFGRGTAASSA
jgi:ubiquinone/menaquinone biosynthesis C-methylase UbiE